jgi:hypothetical protein
MPNKLKILERDIQATIIDYLHTVDGLYFFRSGSGAIVTKDRYFKTGKPGCPDITCCYNGKFIGIEVKTPTGKQSEVQKQNSIDIDKAGGYYLLVRSLKELIKDLKDLDNM